MAEAVALVTGASGGIGLELAKLCAAAGHDVVLLSRRKPELEKIASALERDYRVGATPLAADLADPSAPEAIFRSVPEAGILINNAGFGILRPFASADWGAQARLIQVNVTALAHLTGLYLPGMIARRAGRILNVASTAAFVPGPKMATYYASKAFVFSFTRAIAAELEGTGVTATALCPGPTETNFGDAAGSSHSKLFKGPLMTAAAVAREGFDAMMAGKPEIIAGARNRWLVWGMRLAPRGMLAAAAKKLNST